MGLHECYHACLNLLRLRWNDFKTAVPETGLFLVRPLYIRECAGVRNQLGLTHGGDF